MATDIRQLDPSDPGYDEAVEAALREEDEAHGLEVEPLQDSAPAVEQAADAAPTNETGQAPVEGEQTAAAEPAAEEKPAPAAGVHGKGGNVLPYTVLKSARTEAANERKARQAAEAEAAELRAKLDALQKKDGGTTDDMRERAEAGLLTDEEREDFPALAKIEQALQKLTPKRDADPEPAPKAEAVEQPSTTEDDVQDAIDSIPELAGWQAEGSKRWARALAHDDVLRDSPKWINRPLAERFAHVAKLVAEEFDESPAPSPVPPPTTAKPRQDPRQVAQEAPRATPNTLSDFKGGAPDASRDNLERLPAFKQVAKFTSMSDEEIDRHLARLG